MNYARKDLADYISRNHQPGDMTQSIEKMAKVVGYNFSTIREVLTRLDALGSVSIRQGVGCVVVSDPLDSEEHW